ncbi:MAG: hypothetical protein AAGF73_17550 [Actinomycetota bacterium]
MKIRSLVALTAVGFASAGVVGPLPAHAEMVTGPCEGFEHGMGNLNGNHEHPPFLRVDDVRYNIERWNSPVETANSFLLEGCVIDAYDPSADYERFVISAEFEQSGGNYRPIANHERAPRTSVGSSQFDIVDDPDATIHHYGGDIVLSDVDGAITSMAWHYYPDGA